MVVLMLLWACGPRVHPTIEVSPRTLSFDDRVWSMRAEGGPTGAGPSLWSDAEAHIREADGNLVLTLAAGDEPVGAEVWTPLPPSPCVRVGLAVPELPPEVVVGVFLYRSDVDELDLEISRWGNPDEPDTQFVVAPAGDPTRMLRFERAHGWLELGLGYRGREVAAELRSRDTTMRWSWEGSDGPRRARSLHVNLWALPGTSLAQPVSVRVGYVRARRCGS